MSASASFGFGRPPVPASFNSSHQNQPIFTSANPFITLSPGCAGEF